MSLIQMSVAGGVLIAVILAVRTGTIRYLPKKTFVVLWWLAILRLLTPFSIPWRWSVYSLADPRGALELADDSMAAQILSPLTGREPVPVLSQGPSPFTAVWLCAAVVLALFFVAVYVRCKRALLGSLPVERDVTARWLAGHELRRRIAIRQSDRIGAPMTYGVFHPVILLPQETDFADQERLNYVLQHEYVHICRFDAVTKLLLVIAACIHWFNPLVWIMYLLANRDLELSCDEAVIRSFGNETRASYARTLIAMEEQKSGLVSLGNGFSSRGIEERIRAIMRDRKTTVRSTGLAALLVVILAAGFLSSAVPVGPFDGANSLDPANPGDGAQAGSPAGQTVRYESVDLRHYDNGWSYLHDVLTNHTDGTIVEVQYCMLAYDETGKPLKLQWNILDSSADSTYDYLVEVEGKIPPGQTLDVPGGWSLDRGEEAWSKTSEEAARVAYGLFCVKEVTFEDGSVGVNPDYETWLNTHRGKRMEPAELQSYYPYEQKLL